MFATLMRSRRFAPLFWCQFLGAFNDNFLKNSLVFLILFKLAAEDSEALISLAGAVFIFPFFIISALGGQIADKFDKALIAERLKLIEIGIAGVGVAGFWLALDPDPVLCAVSVRLQFGAVRPHQVRHPARSSEDRTNFPPATR